MARVTCRKVSGLAAVLALAVFTGGGVSSAQDARLERVAFDTGVVTLGANQALRVLISPGPAGGDDTWHWRRQVRGYEGWCEVQCIFSEAGRQESAPVAMTGESAASFDVSVEATYDAVRVLVGVTGRAVTVSAFVIDTLTGGVVLSLNNKDADLLFRGGGR